MEFLFWLEETPLGMWITSSDWGYPIVISAHAVGMAVLVGVALMYSFRILGLANGVPVTTLAAFMPIARAGFVVNLLSGLALFIGGASSFWGSWPFWTKIVMIFVGLALTSHLARVCLNGSGDVTPNHRRIAAVAAFAWVGALIAGRLIAYVDVY